MLISGIYRSTRTASVKSIVCIVCNVWCKVCAIFLVGIFSTTYALADPAADLGAEYETESLIGGQCDALTDRDLSAIDGKGGAAQKLRAQEMFAVILWDERGSGSTRRTTMNSSDGNQNYQNVSLTVNGR